MAKPRKNSRDKGNRGQRAVAALLSEWWGAEFTSTPMSGGFATKQFRAEWNAAADVVTPDKTFPFSVEVKWQEEVVSIESLIESEVSPIWKWWEQCVDEAPPGMIPLLVFKRNKKPWFFMMWTLDQYVPISSKRLYLDPPSWRWRWSVDDELDPPMVVIGFFEDLRKTEVERWRNKKRVSWNIQRT